MPFCFLALGDSYTVGEGLSLEKGWPAQLTKLLAEEDIEVDNPTIIAKTGWTTTELLQGINAVSPAGSFDLVTLLIGVNNQYRKLDRFAYAREFDMLLSQALTFAGQKNSHVVILSIPDWSVTPDAYAQHNQAEIAAVASEIDAFNKVNCRLAYQRGCPYVDVTTLTRLHQNDPFAWADDGLHPALLMYTQWARKLQPVVRTILRSI